MDENTSDTTLAGSIPLGGTPVTTDDPVAGTPTPAVTKGKPGRKPLFPEGSTAVAVRLSQSDHARLAAIAERRKAAGEKGTTVAGVVRAAVDAFLAASV